MVIPSTALRAARPTVDDGMVYARYLDELLPAFRITLGRRRMEILAAAFLQPGHSLSYEHVTFAVRDDAVIGVLSGYSKAQHQASSAVLKRVADSSIMERLGAALLVVFLRRFNPDADNEYYVSSLALDRELRRQGIGSVLMDFAEGRAREYGAARLSLDVEAGNESARAFYERRGMAVESKWPASRFLPAATVRMVKRL